MADTLEPAPVPAEPSAVAPVMPVPPVSAAAAPPGAQHRRTAGSVARAFLSVVLIVLGVLCLVISPVAIWGRNLVLDTNRYVETVAPLVHNPGVQDVIVTQVDKQVEAH